MAEALTASESPSAKVVAAWHLMRRWPILARPEGEGRAAGGRTANRGRSGWPSRGDVPASARHVLVLPPNGATRLRRSCSEHAFRTVSEHVRLAEWAGEADDAAGSMPCIHRVAWAYGTRERARLIQKKLPRGHFCLAQGADRR
jgi:hypothetical protein